MYFQQNFRQLSRLIWLMVLLAALIMFIGRGVFLFNIVDSEQIVGRWDDLFRTFFIGGRFDLKIATIAFAPLFLLGLASAASPGFFKRLLKIMPAYSVVIFFLIISLTIGNYYYYLTYGNYIDIFIFGLIDDDTGAVLSNAWADFPIFLSFIASVSITILATFILKFTLEKIQLRQWKPRHNMITAMVVISMVFSYVLLARGSIGTFPLKRYHANVSDYEAFNKVTPNALIALHWANGDYKKQSKFKMVTQAELDTQMLKVLGKLKPEYKTPKNNFLAENPPHVVMVLMEGMGANVMIEDDATSNDLLGALRPAFETDFVFSRFLASTSATIDSMMMMLFHSNIPTISHSNVQKVVLPSSAVLPYKEAGYERIFITAGNGMWRNLVNYLPLQGFDRLIDENIIKREYPDAEKYADTWGVPDEFVFKYAEKLLKEANKPQLIYILTVTNHSPFRPPESYQPKPVKVSERLEVLLGPLADQAEKLLETYQYANDALGRFIQNIKASGLGAKTLISATGDHRVRYLNTQRIDETGLTYAVPFYLYVPEPILTHTAYKFDAQRIGSHRDIFPTLYHFSLSDTDYISLGGENLLSPSEIANFGYNTARVITAQGAYNTAMPEKLYPWKADGLHSDLTAIENARPTMASDYRRLQDVYLRSQVAGITSQ